MVLSPSSKNEEGRVLDSPFRIRKLKPKPKLLVTFSLSISSMLRGAITSKPFSALLVMFRCRNVGLT
jgi:hypothetical protein